MVPYFLLSFSYLSVELHGQDGVGIGVVADLGSLLEMTDFELPWGLQAYYGHQAAGEQPLHNTHILCVRWQGHTRTNRKKSVTHNIFSAASFHHLLAALP